MSNIINDEFIKGIVASIETEIGKGFAIRAEGDYVTSRVKRVITTKCLPIDRICCKTEKEKIGIPVGRILEIVGPEGAGKSTLLLHICNSVSKSGGVNTFFEGEHKFDPIYAEKLGAEMHIFSQPNTLEDMLDALTSALKNNIAMKERYKNDFKEILLLEEKINSGKKIKKFKINKETSFNSIEDLKKYKEHCEIIIKKIFGYYTDSLASFDTISEFEKRKTCGMGEHARIISQALRIISKLIARAGAIWVVSNQERWSMKGQKITFGGEAMKYYASLRLRVSRISTIEKNNIPVSNECMAKVIKSCVSKPFRTCRFFIDFGKGINYWGSSAAYLEDKDVIKNSGSWKVYKLKNGKEITWQNDEGLKKVLTKSIKKEWKNKIKELD